MSTKGAIKERPFMRGEIHKAYKVLLKLQNPKYFDKDQSIPVKILRHAKGIAFITLVRAGFVFNGTIGSGIVIARLPDGSWSGPSSIAAVGMGWGALIGASSTDAVVILNTDAAVRAFTSLGQVNFGANLSLAAGPVGRDADITLNVGNKGVAPCYSYSHSRGLFAGLSLQGAILITRKKDNEKFYGKKVKAREILAGKVEVPYYQDLQLLYEVLRTVAQDNPINTAYSKTSFNGTTVKKESNLNGGPSYEFSNNFNETPITQYSHQQYSDFNNFGSAAANVNNVNTNHPTAPAYRVG